jgi:MoaA/NifB/PqqE/SkfB family radical SAM enzyme
MHIKSSGFGDPLLYKHLFEMYKYTRNIGMINSLNTNGKNLNKHIDNILKYVDLIRFSLDAGNSNIFNRIHGANDFDDRWKDISELVNRRNEEQENLIIGVHYVVLPDNLESLEELVIKSKEAGIDYIDVTLSKFDSGYTSVWDDVSFEKAKNIVWSLKKYIDDDFNVVFPSEITFDKESLRKFREDRNKTSICWQYSVRHYITPSGEYGACNAFLSQKISKKTWGNIYTDNPSKLVEHCKNFCKKPNEDCRYCVIPHGIFNDVCQLIYDDINKKG